MNFFSFMYHFLDVKYKKSLPNVRPPFLLMCFSRSFLVFRFIFKARIHLSKGCIGPTLGFFFFFPHMDIQS